ncbi:MAG: nucleotidyltransferase domain-containing protein [Candidatus Aenigmatarchaeota archaeon]
MEWVQYNNMREDFQLTKTDVRILKFFIKNIAKEFSINNISDKIEITYPTVWERILELKKRDIVKIKEINPTQKLCSLNTRNNNNVSIFSYIEFLRKDDFFTRKKELKTITDDILNRINGNSFTLILFGSHVKSKETASSDIDILLLIPSMKDENRVMNSIATAERLTNRKMHTVSMTYNDFFDSLKKESATLSKEVLENHIIVYGAEAFYRAMMMYG